MHFRYFESNETLIEAATELWIRHTTASGPLRAVMLAGGRTPLPMYQRLAQISPPVDSQVIFFPSDERHVPWDHPQSNWGVIRPLLLQAGVKEEQMLDIRTDAPLEEAAERFHRILAELLARGARLSVGFLGLGADGHTASLFSFDDLDRARGRLAIAVRRNPPPDRISVTPELLRRFELLIFLVSGADKRDTVATLLRSPDRLPAGRSVSDAPHVEVWYAGPPIPSSAGEQT